MKLHTKKRVFLLSLLVMALGTILVIVSLGSFVKSKPAIYFSERCVEMRKEMEKIESLPVAHPKNKTTKFFMKLVILLKNRKCFTVEQSRRYRGAK